MIENKSDNSAGNPYLLRLDDFTTSGKSQRKWRPGKEGKAFVARQVLVTGTEKTACCLYHERFLLTLQNPQEIIRLDSDNRTRSLDCLCDCGCRSSPCTCPCTHRTSSVENCSSISQDGNRTRTTRWGPGILSPVRLPISPPGQL